RQMKTTDNYFRGFPALWNLVAFYLFLLKPVAPIAATIVACLAVLTFVPFKFLHPVRVARLRALNIAGLIVWSALALIAVLNDLVPAAWGSIGLVVIALYFFTVGVTQRRRMEAFGLTDPNTL